jgi:hypothetical protein
MSLFEPLPIPDKEIPLEHEITQFADHFAELDCAHTFLLESLTSVMSNPEPAKQNYIQGAKQFSEAIQARGQELKLALEHMRKRTGSVKRD